MKRIHREEGKNAKVIGEARGAPTLWEPTPSSMMSSLYGPDQVSSHASYCSVLMNLRLPLGTRSGVAMSAFIVRAISVGL
jgi:hypothetical protein